MQFRTCVLIQRPDRVNDLFVAFLFEAQSRISVKFAEFRKFHFFPSEVERSPYLNNSLHKHPSVLISFFDVEKRTRNCLCGLPKLLNVYYYGVSHSDDVVYLLVVTDFFAGPATAGKT